MGQKAAKDIGQWYHEDSWDSALGRYSTETKPFSTEFGHFTGQDSSRMEDNDHQGLNEKMAGKRKGRSRRDR